MLPILLAVTLVVGLAPAISNTSEPVTAFAANATSSTLAITHHPVGGTFALGGELKLFVRASCGTESLSYQWYRSDDATASPATDTLLTGQTKSILDSTNIGASDGLVAGNTYYYYAVVATIDGSQQKTSTPAAVKVVDKGAITTSLGNGDFENLTGATNTDNLFYYNIPYWKTTHSGTSGGVSRDNAIELSAPSTYGLSTSGHGNKVAELCAYFPSSLYQEVSTIPGRVYSWQLDFGARADPIETVAVVIGSALDGVWNGSGASNAFPYGVNNTCYFNKVVEQLVSDKGVGSVANLRQYSGQGFSVAYNGSPYYVYIVSNTAKSVWKTYAGTYTVPEGQGTSVFGFVSVNAESDGYGNILDNISFKSGEEFTLTDEVGFTGDGQISVAAKVGYSYGIVEERGSTTMPTQAQVTLDETLQVMDDSLGEGTSDWYTPTHDGTLLFADLTPGKTYRVVSVPTKAISPLMGANLSPGLVLDDGYYKSKTIKPVSDGSNGSGGNIQATVEITPNGKAAIIVNPAREDVEYALVDTDGSGTTPTPDSVAADWASPSKDASELRFDGLERGRYYAIVARPYGYTEINCASQVAAGAYVIVKTPSEKFTEIVPADVTRTDDGATLNITNKGVDNQFYLVFDAATGVAVTDSTASDGWRRIQKDGTVSVAVDNPSATYRIVAKEVEAAPSPGIYSYGVAPALAVDFAGEQAGAGADGSGVVSTDVEYRMQAADGDWLVGTGDVWVAGTGSSAVPLEEALAKMQEHGQTQPATLQYRRIMDNPAVSTAVTSTLSVTPRPAYEVSSASIDFVNEKLVAPVGSLGIEVSTDGWVTSHRINAGSSVVLTDLGWTGGSKTVSVRMQSSASQFSSLAADIVLPARPMAPQAGTDVSLTDVDMSASTVSIQNKSARVMQYRPSGSDSAPWMDLAASATATGVTLPDTKAFDVRFAVTADAFASRPLTLSTSNASLDVSVSDAVPLTYGYAIVDHQATVVVSNSGTAVANVTGVTVTGDITLSQGETTGSVAAGSSDSTSWKLSPKAGLSAGTYQAEVTFSYNEADAADTTIYTASYAFSFVVQKADQSAPPSVSVDSITDVQAQLVSSLPDGARPGATLEYSKDGSTWQDAFIMEGLTPEAAYTFSARVAGDANHNASPAATVTARTAHAAPSESTFRVNYVAETASWSSSTYEATGADGLLESGCSVQPGATFSIRAKETPAQGSALAIPASTWTTIVLPGRSAAPSATATYALDSTSGDGVITVSTNPFEYRVAGGNGLFTAVQSSSMLNLAADTYEVRRPATSSAFSSASTTVTVGIQQVHATFDLGGGSLTSGGATSVVDQTVVINAADGTSVENARFTNPGDVVKKGYAFAGWFAGGADVAWDFVSTRPTADTAFTARYTEKRHTATYHAVGGVFPDNSTEQTESILCDFPLTAPVSDPVRYGYAFEGWFTSSDNGATLDTAWDFTHGVMPDADLELYAKWKPVLKASLPVTVKGVVRGDGTVDMPDADSYCLKNSSPLKVQVTSVQMDFAEASEGSDPLFASGRTGVSLAVNGLEVAGSKAGFAQSAGDVAAFAADAATWDASGVCTPAVLKLQLAMALNGATVRPEATDALFAQLTFIVDMEAGA